MVGGDSIHVNPSASIQELGDPSTDVGRTEVISGTVGVYYGPILPVHSLD